MGHDLIRSSNDVAQSWPHAFHIAALFRLLLDRTFSQNNTFVTNQIPAAVTEDLINGFLKINMSLEYFSKINMSLKSIINLQYLQNQRNLSWLVKYIGT